MPNDPVMLLSFINMKLRDQYSSLDSLCDDMNADKDMIIEKLCKINYEYDEKINQFR